MSDETIRDVVFNALNGAERLAIQRGRYAKMSDVGVFDYLVCVSPSVRHFLNSVMSGRAIILDHVKDWRKSRSDD